MKILHVLDSIDLSKGGPSRSVTTLIDKLSKYEIHLVTEISDSPIISDFNDDNKSIFFKNSLDRLIIKKFIIKNSYDIIHIHGVWSLYNSIIVSIAKQMNIPYLITPRGMLEKWALDKKKWKKRIALTLYQRNDLKHATCIHATAESEAQQIRDLGFKNPIAIIPNGINLSDFQINNTSIEKKEFLLLFLSRIHHKKGIELLIDAWNSIDKNSRNSWSVEIAGNGEKKYIESLQKLIEEYGLEDEIKITGPHFGDDKAILYEKCDLFVLPTYSENFGIVVAEALAYGKPVITTKGAPWQDLEISGSGWWIDIGVEPLKCAILEAIRLTREERINMGKRGRKLIVENYSIQTVADKMSVVYEWLLNPKEKPDFIYE